MSVLRNIINIGDITPYIQDALSKAVIPVDGSNVTIPDGLNVTINTTEIDNTENNIKDINDNITSNISNIQLILSNLDNESQVNTIEITDKIEKLLEQTSQWNDNIINLYNESLIFLEALSTMGTPLIKGIYADIPPLQDYFDFDITQDLKTEYYFSGFSFYMYGQKNNDTFDVITIDSHNNEEYLIQNIYNKEVLQNVIINYPIPIEPDEKLIVRFSNNSGNSRQLFIDYSLITLVKND